LKAELFTVQQFSIFKWVTATQTMSTGGLLWTGYSERCLLADCCELGTQNGVYWRTVV